MTKLQDDILDIYNTLQEFSKGTLEGTYRVPIHVGYDLENNSLRFSQGNKTVYMPQLNYYCGKLKELKDTYLLPEDYDYLMKTMQTLIGTNVLIRDRVCVSPEVYGFDILYTRVTAETFRNGPEIAGVLRFASGNSWIFRLITKYKYKHVL